MKAQMRGTTQERKFPFVFSLRLVRTSAHDCSEIRWNGFKHDPVISEGKGRSA